MSVGLFLMMRCKTVNLNGQYVAKYYNKQLYFNNAKQGPSGIYDVYIKTIDPCRSVGSFDSDLLLSLQNVLFTKQSYLKTNYFDHQF